MNEYKRCKRYDLSKYLKNYHPHMYKMYIKINPIVSKAIRSAEDFYDAVDNEDYNMARQHLKVFGYYSGGNPEYHGMCVTLDLEELSKEEDTTYNDEPIQSDEEYNIINQKYINEVK